MQKPVEIETDVKVVEPANVEAKAEEVETPVRLCFRNEYPFEHEPDQKDVESLTMEINGNRVSGEYSWLPAFKDQRIGRFEGLFHGKSVVASYEYMQEGQTAETTITITLESDQVAVEGGDPALGLAATIVRIDC